MDLILLSFRDSRCSNNGVMQDFLYANPELISRIPVARTKYVQHGSWMCSKEGCSHFGPHDGSRIVIEDDKGTLLFVDTKVCVGCGLPLFMIVMATELVSLRQGLHDEFKARRTLTLTTHTNLQPPNLIVGSVS